MAVTTPIKPLINTNLRKTRVSFAKQNVNKVSDILKRNSKEKSNIFSRKVSLRRKREEYEKRSQLEDQLEASKVGTSLFSPLRTAQAVGGGIFKRIINFIAYLGAGWIIRNAPTWIAMGKEFIARIQVTGQILSGFVSNVTNIFLRFGNLLSAVGQNIINFDLFDSTNRVSGAFNELLGTIDNMGSQIEEAFKVFTTPLTEPTYSKGYIPPPGSEAPEGLYERPDSGGSVSGAYDIASRIGANKEQWDIYRNTLAQIESGGRYGEAGGSGKYYDGRYQMGAEAKTDAARILGIPDPGHSSNPNDPRRVAFRKNKELQEKMFAAYTLANHGYLSSNRTYQSKPTIEQKLQVLGYAHNQGAGGAASWLRTGRVGRDGFGTSGTAYTDALSRNFRGRVNPYPDQKIQESPSSPQNLSQRASSTPSTSKIPGKTTGYSQAVSFGKSLLSKGYKFIWQHPDFNWDRGYTGSGKERVMMRSYESYHNYGEALDISAYNGEGKLDALYGHLNKNRNKYGIAELLWRTKGHYDHMHIAFNKLGSTLTSSSISDSQPQPEISPAPSAPSALQEPEALTPEREGQTMFFIDQILPTSPQQVVSTPSPSMPSLQGSPVNEIDMLNNFIKTKLLLDLAYL